MLLVGQGKVGDFAALATGNACGGGLGGLGAFVWAAKAWRVGLGFLARRFKRKRVIAQLALAVVNSRGTAATRFGDIVGASVLCARVWRRRGRALCAVDFDVVGGALAAIWLGRVQARLLFDGSQTCRVAVAVVVIVVIIDAFRLDQLRVSSRILVARQDDRLGLRLGFCILIVMGVVVGRRQRGVVWLPG